MRKPTPGSDNRTLLVCRLLNRRRARYRVTGGIAANLHGSVRATKDVHLLIPKNVANAKRVLSALGELPLGIGRELDAHQVIAPPVTFDQAWPNRVVRRIAGVRVPYLGLAGLIRSKQTGRPSDLADIEVLTGFKPSK